MRPGLRSRRTHADRPGGDGARWHGAAPIGGGARRLAPAARLATVATLTGLLALAAPLPLPAREPVPPADPAFETALLRATNAARADQGVAPLRPDEGLARAARAHAAEMARLAYFSHTSPVPGHADLGARLALAGSPLTTVAENLALLGRPGNAAQAAEQSVDGWLASPGHRRNLLSPDYDAVGFGVARDADGRLYVVQDFGGDPLALEAVTVTPDARDVAIAHLTLEADAPVRAALSLGGGGATPTALAAGRQEVSVALPSDARAQLLVGVPLGGGRYRVDEAGWIDPAGAPWRADAAAPRDAVRVRSVHLERVHQRGARVRLDYRPLAGGELALFVDGADRPQARLAAGRFELFVPASSGAVTLELGVVRPDGRVQVVHRFHLDAATAAPRLLAGPAPGAPRP